MKAWFLPWIWLFLFLLHLINSFPPGRVESEKLFAVHEVVLRDVPVCPFGGRESTKFNKASVLKKDRYGRTLYSYTASCGFFDEEVTIRVIVQKEKGDFAYYYADDCYIFKAGRDVSFDAAEMEALLESNDWGKPLQEEELSRTQYKIRDWREDIIFQLDPDAGDITKEYQLVKEYLNVQESDTQRIILDGLEVDAAGNQILVVYVQDITETPYRNICAYLLLYDGDAEVPILACKKVIGTGMENMKESLRAFREKYFTSNGMY